MEEKSLHELLLDELMEGKASLSPREHAARNEIIALRERLAKYEKPAEREMTQAEAKKK